MEFPIFQPSSWPSFYNPSLPFPSYLLPRNYVHWTETPDSHIYTADLPGVRKEEIKVELEDSLYLIIRNQGVNEATERARSFMRKFRLPSMVDVAGITAGYENGVLTVTVPRSFGARRFRIDPADLSEHHEVLAPAA